MEGLHIGNRIEITHMQFADDTLIFSPKNTKKFKKLWKTYSMLWHHDRA